jgi:hypothetical protein
MIVARRRWSFSLRTLFVAVTIVGCWLGWELYVVRQRRATRKEIESRGGEFAGQWMNKAYIVRESDLSHLGLSLGAAVRRALGDETVPTIRFHRQVQQADLDLVASFPEARVIGWQSQDRQFENSMPATPADRP